MTIISDITQKFFLLKLLVTFSLSSSFKISFKWIQLIFQLKNILIKFSFFSKIFFGILNYFYIFFHSSQGPHSFIFFKCPILPFLYPLILLYTYISLIKFLCFTSCCLLSEFSQTSQKSIIKITISQTLLKIISQNRF